MANRRQWALACAAIVLLFTGTSVAQAPKEIRVGYQPNPIQDASLAMMEKWGAKHGVKITKIFTLARRDYHVALTLKIEKLPNATPKPLL